MVTFYLLPCIKKNENSIYYLRKKRQVTKKQLLVQKFWSDAIIEKERSVHRARVLNTAD